MNRDSVFVVALLSALWLSACGDPAEDADVSEPACTAGERRCTSDGERVLECVPVGDGRTTWKVAETCACEDGACRELGPLEVAWTASPAWGDAPLVTELRWEISGGGSIGCALDLDGDGAADEELADCPRSGSHEATFSEPGEHNPTLVVTSGEDTAEAALRVFANAYTLSPTAVDLSADDAALIGVEHLVPGERLHLHFGNAGASAGAVRGAILYSRDPPGLLVRVVSRDPWYPTTHVEVEVEPATLDDLFEEAFIGVISSAPGVAARKPGKADWADVDEELTTPRLEVSTPPVDVSIDDGTDKLGVDDLVVTGSAQAGVTILVLKKGLLSSLEYDLSVWVDVGASIEGTLRPQLALAKWKKKLASWKLPPFVVAGVPLTLSLEPTVYGEIKLGASMHARLSADVTLSAGVSNLSGDDEAFGSVDLAPGLTLTPSISGELMTPSEAELGVKAGLSLKLIVRAFELAGLYGEADVSVKLTPLEVTQDQVCADLVARIEGNVGAELKFLKIFKAEVQKTLAFQEWPFGEPLCVPGDATPICSCADASCGDDDGCGGVCDGWCAGADEICEDGVCVPEGCTPSCAGASCGDDDGCGGVCDGWCAGADEICEDGVCVPDGCTPSCAGASCGDDDGCGGVCDGPCPDGGTCNDGSCVPASDPPPEGQITAPADGTTVTGDFTVTAEVTDDQAVAKVSVLVSGPGDASFQDSASPNQAEVSFTTAPVPASGWPDGPIYVSLWAEDGVNEAVKLQTIELTLATDTCTPDCAGKSCGADGCGGTCAPGCAGGQACSASGSCQDVTAGCEDGWCLIPAGTFTMGSPDDEPCRGSNEGPQHEVTLTRPFLMKQTEVTQGEWEALMGNNPSGFEGCGANCPVERVNWWEAAAYCNALSQQAGLEECYVLEACDAAPPGMGMDCLGVTFAGLNCTGYRLPTEAEWEYATRAGTTTAYWSGPNDADACYGEDSALSGVAWYWETSGGEPHPVGQLLPNALGLYDVHGNVYEWVWDWYDDDAYEVSNAVDPLGPSSGTNRVLRGGSWNGYARSCRSASRYNGYSPGYRYYYLGFRPARSLP